MVKTTKTERINPLEFPKRRSISVEISREMSKDRITFIKRWLNNLLYKMDNMCGYLQLDGITAAQVGSDRRVLLVNLQCKHSEIIINPVVVFKSDTNELDYERCICGDSIPQLINRPSSIKIEYFNEKFNRISRTFNGKDASLILHLIEHLDCIPLESVSVNRKQLKENNIDFPYFNLETRTRYIA